MALTEDQKTACRVYLGWPDRFLSVDSAMELALQAAGDKESTLAKIVDLLEILDTIDEAIRAPGVRLRLQATQVGKLILTGGGEIDNLRGLGRQYSSQLAALLGVEVRHDCWSEGSPSSSSLGRGEIPFG